jgi:hypothetical protein
VGRVGIWAQSRHYGDLLFKRLYLPLLSPALVDWGFVLYLLLASSVLDATYETSHLAMHFLSLGLLSALAAQAVAVPVAVDHVVHERRDYVPESWVKRSRLEPGATLPVRIGMAQQNLDKGYDMLLEV